MSGASTVCECGCALADIEGQKFCADTLAKFRLTHGYDYALRLKAGQTLFGKAIHTPPLDCAALSQPATQQGES